MLLTIDVGNTQTVLGLYEAGSPVAAADSGLVDYWRIRTDHDRTSDEHAVLIRNLLRQGGRDF
jgi:type III pantothenate kinase